ncbi:MAG: hypothetical protein FWD73_06740 [Polyangiaceae bacterium]|nr:hypothetical protein [Polyangiaceae bacterium]
MIVALGLGLVLVMIPLYLWRRPRAQPITTPAGESTAAIPTTIPTIPAPSVESSAQSKPVISDVKVVACHNPGANKKLPVEPCDHIVELEKSFTKAVSESATCVPPDAGGGAIAYALEVSFKRKSIFVYTPKDGRTFNNAKLVSACLAEVKAKLHTAPLDALAHRHSQYKLSITASYPGFIKP